VDSLLGLGRSATFPPQKPNNPSRPRVSYGCVWHESIEKLISPSRRPTAIVKTRAAGFIHLRQRSSASLSTLIMPFFVGSISAKISRYPNTPSQWKTPNQVGDYVRYVNELLKLIALNSTGPRRLPSVLPSTVGTPLVALPGTKTCDGDD
jgi:hypothetical protein